jgi:hypothetical protein
MGYRRDIRRAYHRKRRRRLEAEGQPRYKKIWRECLNKASYATKKQAERIINKVHEEGRPTKLRVYECPHCKLWHITSLVL